MKHFPRKKKKKKKNIYIYIYVSDFPFVSSSIVLLFTVLFCNLSKINIPRDRKSCSIFQHALESCQACQNSERKRAFYSNRTWNLDESHRSISIIRHTYIQFNFSVHLIIFQLFNLTHFPRPAIVSIYASKKWDGYVVLKQAWHRVTSSSSIFMAQVPMPRIMMSKW